MSAWLSTTGCQSDSCQVENIVSHVVQKLSSGTIPYPFYKCQTSKSKCQRGKNDNKVRIRAGSGTLARVFNHYVKHLPCEPAGQPSFVIYLPHYSNAYLQRIHSVWRYAFFCFLVHYACWLVSPHGSKAICSCVHSFWNLQLSISSTFIIRIHQHTDTHVAIDSCHFFGVAESQREGESSHSMLIHSASCRKPNEDHLVAIFNRLVGRFLNVEKTKNGFPSEPNIVTNSEHHIITFCRFCLFVRVVLLIKWFEQALGWNIQLV